MRELAGKPRRDAKQGCFLSPQWAGKGFVL
jgi:hypothetical protein